MREKLLRALGPVIGLALFCAALWALHRMLGAYRYQDIAHAFSAIPNSRVAVAMILTAMSFLALTGYDTLAIHYLRRSLPWRKTGFAAAVSYAFSNTIGMSVLISGSVRYRLYSAWGFSAIEVAKIVIFSTFTYWLGILAIGGAILLAAPPPLPEVLQFKYLGPRTAGAIMIALPILYLCMITVHLNPLKFRNWVLDPVKPGLALSQVAIGALDWLLAGLTLYALLPHPAGFTISYGISVYMVAQTAGLISHVPGGLGVFDSLVLLLLPASITGPEALAALLAYRMIYYLLPLALAAIALGGRELLRPEYRLAWLSERVVPWMSVLFRKRPRS
ncbi:MAG: lysylphosphatidylglycerol synthase domain-containing protein [Gammaproteobacteria bacterium]